MTDCPPYLDCNATTPLHPAARDAMLPWLTGGRVGNPGSRTHAYGSDAQKAVTNAREQMSRVIGMASSGVVFTSGATESSNIALLGLAQHGAETGRCHIISTEIEHKATLEPLGELAKRGCEVTLVKPDGTGRVSADALLREVRDDTLLISLIHVNNETGVVQPVAEVAEGLDDKSVFLHVDASQSFGKELSGLVHERIDLMSVSGHKFGGPIGVGALLLRKRKYRYAPLNSLTFGGGQERGLRPGTIPVMLVVGMGAAASAALESNTQWHSQCTTYRDQLLEELQCAAPAGFDLNTDVNFALPNCINLSFRDGGGDWLDSEAVLLSLKNFWAASNGSACTSAGIEPSHVLVAQNLPMGRVRSAIRLSWCERTPAVDWIGVKKALSRLI
ncbi:MAG: aminotransferase class V-fold PLP-dependent enzyme [Planctomycetota bacterium]